MPEKKRPHPIESTRQQIHSGSILLGMLAATVVIFGSQYIMKTARARANAPRSMARYIPPTAMTMGRVLNVERIAAPTSYNATMI